MEENKNPHIRVLFCADKTPNMRDMNRLLAKGHVPEKIAVHYTDSVERISELRQISLP